jgi:prepilin-type N-terminal cleavage/methylation domain-containing protein
MKRRLGYTLIETLVVVAIVAILIALILVGVQRVRASSTKVDCLNRIRQLALACQNYAGDRGALPPGCDIKDGKAKMPYSGYQLHLLPYIERNELYRQAVEDYAKTPWQTSPISHRAFAEVVPAFICPADSRIRKKIWVERYSYFAAMTSYVGVCGKDCVVRFPNGLLFTDSQVRLNQVTDGLSNTLLLGERPPESNFVHGWWYAGIGQEDSGSVDMILGVQEYNFVEDSKCPKGKRYEFGPGKVDDSCSVFHFWSQHTGEGGHFAMGDGSARFIGYSGKATMPALASRAGNDSISE